MKHIVQKVTYAVTLCTCLSVGIAVTNAHSSHAEAINPLNSGHTEQRVNLNSADARTLATLLDGIGLTKAERIVAWRKANGRFIKAEQLLEVKGIGEATLKKNLSRISL